MKRERDRELKKIYIYIRENLRILRDKEEKIKIKTKKIGSFNQRYFYF